MTGFVRRFGARLLVPAAVAAAVATAWAQGAPQWPTVSADAMVAHVKKLASDEFEGRAPGSKGEDLTVAYLTEQFKRLGLAPGNPNGTYTQKVPLVSITAAPTATLQFSRDGRQQPLKYRDDFVAWTRRAVPRSTVENSDVVFVGYGVQAPEFQWDDYKGVDLTGKTMVVLVGDPPVPDPADATKLDPKTFGGRAMTYYGRWTYKFDIGAEKKAAAVIIVHETGPAGYPFNVVQGMGGEKFNLNTPNRNMDKSAIEAWMSIEQTKALFALAGQDFDALKAKAATRGFTPVPLGVKASAGIDNTIRELDSQNVAARLQGSDPKLRDEYVIYTAHWDHFGIGEPVNGDRIYNGALDNASGTAALLEMAHAWTKIRPAPKRSILFLAVTAEEQGLLGSEFYATSPLYPLAKTLAVINMDVMNIYGRTRDMTIVGLGNSELDDFVQNTAKELDRVVRGDPEPERGGFYRSDHFPFAKQGVPSLNAGGGADYIGKPADYAKRVREEYTTKYYHQPSDEYRPEWDLSGAVEDLAVLMKVGYAVANADRFPNWKPGTEFKAARDKMMAGSGR